MYLTAFGINIILALTAYKLKLIDLSGSISGFLIGTVIYCTSGYEGFILLVSFFVMVSLASKAGYKKKLEQNIAQDTTQTLHKGELNGYSGRCKIK